MSVNCIHCVKNKRTDFDLLCDECRIRQALERLVSVLSKMNLPSAQVDAAGLQEAFDSARAALELADPRYTEAKR
jgi:hypothetical protein